MLIDLDRIRLLQVELQQLHHLLTTGKEVDTPLFRQHFDSYKTKRKQLNEALEMAKMEFNHAADTVKQFDSKLRQENFQF